MSCSQLTSANSDSASTIAGSRRRSSTVTETLTSEVVTTSTGVLVPLEHLEQAAQEAVRHQHPGGGDVDDGDVLLGGQRGEGPVAGRPLGGDQRARACSARFELRMRTGMLRATAGWIVAGCRTLAPK